MASVPAVEHYQLRFRIDPENRALAAEAEIKVRNSADRAVAVVPVLLYRLMEVESAADRQGKPLAFTQAVVKFTDQPTWQVNYVQVTLPAPLESGQTTTIHLKYAGALFGYPEVMQYVRDTISEDYSLLRSESMAYPIVSAPAYTGWSQFLRKSSFDYEIETVVPAGYAAVCSGNENGEPQTKDGALIYHCSGPPGSSQIDVAIAKFRVLNDPQRHLRVYALPDDAEAGKQVMAEMHRALEFYTAYFGPRESPGGLTLIEIPSDWGSYALPGRIFQDAAAFKDPKRVSDLYHEVAHRWNAKASDQVQRSRWFDEAFASYFEALALRQFQGPEAFHLRMERYRENFKRDTSRDPRGRTTAIADYGKDELGGFSYTKGAWSLYVLHTLLGEAVFRRSIAEFIAAYGQKPAGFDDFRRSVEKTSGRELKCWFERWISGAESSTLLLEGKSAEEMVGRCQRESTPGSSPLP